MTFLASFLTTLGLLQLAAVYFHLRGVSITGPLIGPGVVIGAILVFVGVWLAVDEPIVLLVVYALLSLPLAAVLLAIAGIVVNLQWDPMRDILSNPDQKWAVENVSIPVQLVHVRAGEQTANYMMPATYLVPKSWQIDGNRGYGMAVMVICGAGDTRMTFKWTLFRELLVRDIAVLTIDPPGHGEFQNVPMTVANAQAAGKAALDWLCGRKEVQQVGGCGISFGGNQISALAAIDSRIVSVALISVPIRLKALTRSVYVNEIVRLFAFPRNLGILRDGSLFTHWREYGRLKGIWCGQSLQEMIAAFDMMELVRRISPRPILFVHGKRDSAIPTSNSEEMYRVSASPRDILLVKQATHVSVVLYPDAMAYIADWFVKWLTIKQADVNDTI